MKKSKHKQKIIDVHNHPDWLGHNLEKFIVNIDQYGIAKTWLLNWECPVDEYDQEANSVATIPSGPIGDSNGPIPFSRCLSYVERCPERFILGYSPDPRKPDAIDNLQAATEIYGVKVCGELKVRMMFDNRDAIRMYKFCGERKLPVVVHLQYELPDPKQKYPRPSYWYGGNMEAFEIGRAHV